MNEFPTLPEHYVKRIIADMLPDDIFYLKSETLCVDHQTLRPYFNKFTPLSPYDKNPQKLVGRYGLMRVFNENTTSPIDGYVIDMRFIDPFEIEQDDITPPHDADTDTLQERSEDTKDLLSPLGIIVNEADMSKERILGHEAIHPYLLYLCSHSDAIHQSIAQKTPSQSKRSSTPRRSRKSNQTSPSKNN